jgi:hypothetical protein
LDKMAKVGLGPKGAKPSAEIEAAMAKGVEDAIADLKKASEHITDPSLFWYIQLKDARACKMVDMLILSGVVFKDFRRRNQHVHEFTLPWVWGSGLPSRED